MLRARVWAEHRWRWDFIDDPPGGPLFRVAAAGGGSLTIGIRVGSAISCARAHLGGVDPKPSEPWV